MATHLRIFENYLDDNWDLFLTFAISLAQSLWVGSRIGSKVKISHYIQPNDISSALFSVTQLKDKHCMEIQKT